MLWPSRVADSHLGRPHDLDLALLVVARNEASELEGCEEHDRDQQGCREQEGSTYLQCASHRSLPRRRRIAGGVPWQPRVADRERTTATGAEVRRSIGV